MTPRMRLGAWAAGIVAVVLAVLYGPVIAGYVFVGAAFAIIAVLITMQAVRAIGDWRLDHPWKLHRRAKRA
jgi:hypothetical protein